MFAACNSNQPSKSELADLKMLIQLHNINAKAVCNEEKLNKPDSYSDAYFDSSYFQPYMIERDTALTVFRFRSRVEHPLVV